MNGQSGKYVLLVLIATIFFIVSTTCDCSARQDSFTVVIDAAHGGDDKGVSSEKILEKDLTLSLALSMRDEARKSPGLNIILIRETDKMVSTAGRAEIVASIKPDVMLSLHLNSGFGKKASGYEIYFPGFGQAVSAGKDAAPIIKDMTINSALNDSVRLSQRIQASLETVFPRKWRGLREAPSPLLEGMTVPGLIVELGFATESGDRKMMTSEKTQKGTAKALVSGLRDYLRRSP